MYSRATGYLRCFNVYILAPYAFHLSYYYIMVRFLYKMYLEVRHLLEGGAYFDMIVKCCGA